MLKRLRTLKHLLLTKDYAEVSMELQALQQEAEQHVFEQMAGYIAHNDFKDAIDYCEQLISNQSLPTRHEASISGLRTQISLLRTQISVKQFKVAEANHRINHFRMRHNSEIGMLITQILKLKAELLFLQLIDAPEIENKYVKARQDHKAYARARREFKKASQIQLTEVDRQRARKLFREASKLCHPDVVDEKLQEIAKQLFTELNEAYANNDLRKIESLLADLRNQRLVMSKNSEVYSQITGLQALAMRLQAELAHVEAQLSAIESTEVYRTLNRISDLDEYFEQLKQKFEDELHALKNDYAEAKRTSEN
jgi:hypothetical protein